MTSIRQQNPLARAFLLSILTVVSAVGLAGCSGGGEDAKTCEPTVGTGEESGGYTDGAGQGGGAGDSGDAGPGLGKFQNAIVAVELVDGSLRSAEIDRTRGVVKISLCGYDKPVHLKVSGKPDNSSQYYDESLRKYVPFPAGQEMHAVVSKFTKNVGITALTDAAWYYIQASHGLDGWKTAVNVDEANGKIKDVFNSYLPKDLQIADITRLPELLSESTGTVEDNAAGNGKYGIVTSGLARAAGLLLQPGAEPNFDTGKLIAKQLGRDLCDGKLDYTACDGKPFFAESEMPAYLPAQLGEFLNAGIGDIAAKCGSEDMEANSLRIVGAKLETSFPYGRAASALEYSKPLYSKRTPMWLLRNDGKVFFWTNQGADPELYEGLKSESFRQLFSQGPLLGATTGGKVYSRDAIAPVDDALPRKEWSAKRPSVTEQPNYFGASTIATMETIMSDALPQFHWWSTYQLIARKGNGEAYIDPRENWGFSGRLDPLGVSKVSSIGVTNGWGMDQEGYFAVTVDGKVFSKGYNFGGQLGLPGMDDAAPSRITVPTQITFPENDVFIVSVAGRQLGAYALDRDGKVWSWGDDAADVQLTRSRTPVRIQEFDTYAPVRQIECAHMRQCAAISKTGEMLVWGTFYKKSVDDVPENTSMDGEKKIYRIVSVDLEGHRVIYIGSSGWTVYGVRDDGQIVVFPTTPEERVFLQPPVAANRSGTCMN